MSEGIVVAVASATERDPLALPPLYSVVDPDALDALLATTSARNATRGITATFEYAGCTVTVEDPGRIHVERFAET
ncbi:HalOD1 output domain-containing protein [Halobacterium wangiae]|uniref:HalOD1 output domain-containing protein n=1 Tax=Halobacterium wangiae TaxID=2902623 RepID=UPI001E2E3C1B|nr:HalOD1 output domain-containing protein [Halobacterium wangiae]